MSKLERTPPHDLDAERAVLGSMLLEPAAIEAVRDLPLTVSEFYRDAHGAIFDAMLELAADGEPVDSITLRERLQRAGDLARVGGDEYLLGLTDVIPTVANALAHARIVREKALVRRLIHVCYEQIARGFGDYGDASEYVARAEQAIAAVASQRIVTSEPHSVHEAAWSAAAQLQHSSAPQLYQAPQTGFAVTDYAIRALPRRTMMVLGGRTGCGKSSMKLAMALAMAQRGHRVGIVSLEDAAEIWGARALSYVAPVNSEEIIRSSERSARERDELIAHAMLGLKKLEQVGIYLEYALNRPLRDVLDAIRALARKGCDVIMVDYLQAILGMSQLAGSRREGVSEALQRIKSECQRLNVALVVGSQLSRPGSENEFREPRASELKESGDIENMAEVIMLLWKTSDDDNATIMGKIAKVKWTARRPRFRIEHNAFGAITNLHEVKQQPAEQRGAREFS